MINGVQSPHTFLQFIKSEKGLHIDIFFIAIATITILGIYTAALINGASVNLGCTFSNYMFTILASATGVYVLNRAHLIYKTYHLLPREVVNS